MTQICHSLRTRGDMSFEEITEVVPWDICALDCDQHLSDEQVSKIICSRLVEVFGILAG